MKIETILLKSAQRGLTVQRGDGSMPEGHNGPWNDVDTPVRNTANWLKLFLFAYKKTGKQDFLISSKKALEYLLSDKSMPFNLAFYCRKNKRKINGLIGQAWALEALIDSYLAFKESNILKTILDVFLVHRFDFKKGLWHEINLDGTVRDIGGAYNQQLWFAVIGSKILKVERNLEIKKRLDNFLNNFDSNFFTHQNGAIKHILIKRDNLFRKLNSLRLLCSGRIEELSLGYHSFNLYALALLRESYPELFFWQSEKFQKALKFIETEEYKKNIKKNKYGFGYNVTGIELAYALNKFVPNSENLQKYWLEKQFKKNFDFKKNLLCKNTCDPETLSARIYEAIPLNDLIININE